MKEWTAEFNDSSRGDEEIHKTRDKEASHHSHRATPILQLPCTHTSLLVLYNILKMPQTGVCTQETCMVQFLSLHQGWSPTCALNNKSQLMECLHRSKSPRFSPQHCIDKPWWYIPRTVLWEIGEDLKLKVLLGYKVSLKPSWIQKSVSQRQQNNHNIVNLTTSLQEEGEEESLPL